MLEATGKAMSYGQSPPTTMATLPTLIAIGKALPSADKFLGLMAVNVKIGDRRELPRAANRYRTLLPELPTLLG